MSVLKRGQTGTCRNCGCQIKVYRNGRPDNYWDHSVNTRCNYPQPLNEHEAITKEQQTANNRQVDGDHYQSEIQPWDFIEANNLTFIEGSIVKYVSRHRKKNGVRDLKKAQHFLEKLIEIEQSKPLGD